MAVLGKSSKVKLLYAIASLLSTSNPGLIYFELHVGSNKVF